MRDPQENDARLRAAEREVDDEHRRNGLMAAPFAVAALWILVVAEQIVESIEAQRISEGDMRGRIDAVVNVLRHPLLWAHKQRALTDTLDALVEPERNIADALSLWDLAEAYEIFSIVLTFWSRDWLTLDLQGDLLAPSDPFSTAPEYDAYNRLAGPELPPDYFTSPRVFRQRVQLATRDWAGRFDVELTPSLLVDLKAARRRQEELEYALPPEWTFSSFSLGDFREVHGTVRAIATAWQLATRFSRDAARGGDVPLSVLIRPRRWLIEQVCAVTGLGEERVRTVLEYLTYGSRGIRTPDPALQPLLPMYDDMVLIAPLLWIYPSPERNLVALLNLIPEERSIYSRLHDRKETIMRQNFMDGIATRPYRVVHAELKGKPVLPDVDCAVIDDAHRVCLLAELKWFYAPAGPADLDNKAKEIRKGISQVRKLREAFSRGDPRMLHALGIDPGYRLCVVVVSENWIGSAPIQERTVPVIQRHHLEARINRTSLLGEVADWLEARAYLPVNGREFDVRWVEARIAQWRTRWYGLEFSGRREFWNSWQLTQMRQ